MTMNTTSTTIDLGELITLRDELAPLLDDLCSRIERDDAEAYELGCEYLGREEDTVDRILVQFDTVLGVEAGGSQSLHSVLYAFGATGDLGNVTDAYQDRVSERAVDELVDEFVQRIKVDCRVTFVQRSYIVEEVRRVINEGRQPVLIASAS